MMRCVVLVRTDVSEELSASFIRVTRIGELGTTLALTRNRRTCTLCVPLQKLLILVKVIELYREIINMMEIAIIFLELFLKEVKSILRYGLFSFIQEEKKRKNR
jgi:hypothetical protein